MSDPHSLSTNSCSTPTQKIIPAIWCNANATEAAEFYASVFRDAAIVESVSGMAEYISIHGQHFLLINGNDMFAPNASISGMLNFNPLLFGSEAQARAYLDELYEKLSTGGVLMELGEYPFSKRYAWVRDKFGFTWQLMLTDPNEPPSPFVIPSFLFGDDNQFQAKRATDTWIELFPNSSRRSLVPYPPADEAPEDAVMFSEFLLDGHNFSTMDAGRELGFTFTPGVSMVVYCKDQEEIDKYWAVLSKKPEAERCGWCVDEWGVSWQVIPHNINELMSNEETRNKILEMKKIDLMLL